MLERVRLQNFQRHVDLVVDFVAGVTTIVGPSDRGKSAVMRAIRWVCTNSPNGDGFITWGAECCTVTLWVDGHEIKRSRGKGVNTYEVNGVVLRGFGVNVPTEVSEILRLDTGGLNFQRQIDTHLWFNEKSSHVIGEINRLVDMSAIDTSTSRLANKHRQALTRFNMLKDDEAAAAKAYESHLDTPRMAEEWDAVIAIANKTHATRQQVDRLQGLADNVAALSSNVAALSYEGQALLAVAQVGFSWRAANDDVAGLEKLVGILKTACLKQAFGPPPTMPAAVVESFTAWQAARAAVNELGPLVRAVAAVHVRATAYKTEAFNLRETIKGIELCPTCNRPIVNRP